MKKHLGESLLWRSISNLISLLLVIGIVLASSILVSSILTSQIGRGSETPIHLQVIDKGVETPSPTSCRVTVTFYNPSNKVLRVSPVLIRQCVNGFEDCEPIGGGYRFLSLDISPGETGKLEVIGSHETTIRKPCIIVLLVWVYDINTYSGYLDYILIPLR